MRLLLVTILFLVSCNKGEAPESDAYIVNDQVEDSDLQHKTLEQLNEIIRKQVADRDIPTVYRKYSKNLVYRKKLEGRLGSNECFTCPEYNGDDPNMKGWHQ